MSLMTISSGRISDSASIVPVWHVIDQTGSRAINSTYTNLTNKTLFVTLSFAHTITVNGGNTVVIGHANGLPQHRSGVLEGLAGQIIYGGFTLIVSPNETFGVNEFVALNGTNLLYSWIEAY